MIRVGPTKSHKQTRCSGSYRSAQAPEKVTHFASKRLRLLQRSEMTALRHHAPASDVGIDLLASVVGAVPLWGTERSPLAP